MRTKSFLFAVTLLALPAFLVGCGGQQDADVEMAEDGQCPAGMGTLPSYCCPTPPANRPECRQPGDSTLAAIQANGANAINAANSGNMAAIQLVNDSSREVDGTASAATEATTIPGTDNTPTRGGISGAAEIPRIAGSSSARTSGGRGGAGGSGIGGGDGSGVRTSPAELAKKTDEATLGKGGRDSAYGEGGGAKPEGGADPFRALAGLGQGGDGGLGAGGSTQVALGPDGQPLISPMGSLDPEDYFKRGGNINLFRRVNAAHERTSQRWAINHARTLAN